MEALESKRSRLRQELQQAYGSWLLTTASYGGDVADANVSVCADSAKAHWFEYLAARQRLVTAYAEQPVTKG